MDMLKQIAGRLIRGASGFVFATAATLVLYYSFFSDEEQWWVYALASASLFPISYLIYKISEKFYDGF